MMDDGSYSSTGPIFVLAPIDDAARYATSLSANYEHLHYDQDNNPVGLLVNLSSPEKTVYTLGRPGPNIDPPDIHISEPRPRRGLPHISHLHASFQLVPETGAVLLWDYSSTSSVKPFGAPNSWGYTVKFRSESSPRSVLVARGINTHVAFASGSNNTKWCQFEIQWQSEGMYHFHKDEPYFVGPQESRIKRYVQHEKLGGGSYGTVYSALDAETGQMIAVKKFHNLTGKHLTFATREVDNLKKKALRQHPHILRILDSAGGGEKDNWGEIFMPLKKGNLKDLCETIQTEEDRWELSNQVLYQILLALNCLADNDVVHRDVKPDNILFDFDENGDYRFCLGDFGLSNDPERAITAAGTEPFMAPEICYRKKQTTKVDIWSLFATIVWMRNSDFRAACSRLRAPDLHKWIISISKTAGYEPIRAMASHDPKKRPSAKKQLDIIDSGEFEDFGEEESDPGDLLSAQFVQAMSLQGDSSRSYGSVSIGYPTSPEMAYYEPYASGVYTGYGGAGGMKEGRYAPPPMGTAEAPRNQGAWVRPYDNPYGPPQSQDSDEGTVMPEIRTAVPTIAEDDVFAYEEYMEERRRMKGKNRSGI
ncbi:hypothetical protein QC762_310540 [Podospora pseudocomata]|uniref:non-specific serine/threonine protein kinase n=1 Tax=Podospora pseudocomata TaxID=2093779 RepID=A0ABR0GL39_9PEZI|nr:hypothetical protein QC762_310540 [Podospora pseudocomata]